MVASLPRDRVPATPFRPDPMIEERLSELIRQALSAAGGELGPVEAPAEIELTRPRHRAFGDLSTNAALALAASAGRKPREVAEAIVRHLPASALIDKVEVAGPGFINFHLSHAWLHEVLKEVVEKGVRYGWSEEEGESVQVEYVSVNPTGPLHVGHGRNAGIGDALANVLAATGRRVQREYYLNDYGTQMELFGASIEARYLELHGVPARVPEGGYHGSYVTDLARDIAGSLGGSLLDLPPDERRVRLREEGYRRALAGIRSTLERFGVRFDRWFSQRTLHDTGAVDLAIQRLRDGRHAYEGDGALYFRATEFGDEKDRVLVRRTGEPTYFAADCAYVVDKFGRGFDRVFYVWGADHHGAVKRLQGATQALGLDPARVEFLIIQLVRLSRGGEPVRMSKRTGETVTLDEVLDEVGPDAARYTLLTRSHDSPLEFDIEEVARQSLENPVFYVQYAHARVASILRHAEERGIVLKPVEEADLGLLSAEVELDLLRKISELPEQIQAAAALRAPYRLTRYAEELAARFHRFYTDSRVVTEDASLTQARLWLAVAAKHAIAGVLSLLGVSAPESMQRIEE